MADANPITSALDAFWRALGFTQGPVIEQMASLDRAMTEALAAGDRRAFLEALSSNPMLGFGVGSVRVVGPRGAGFAAQVPKPDTRGPLTKRSVPPVETITSEPLRGPLSPTNPRTGMPTVSRARRIDPTRHRIPGANENSRFDPSTGEELRGGVRPSEETLIAREVRRQEKAKAAQAEREIRKSFLRGLAEPGPRAVADRLKSAGFEGVLSGDVLTFGAETAGTTRIGMIRGVPSAPNRFMIRVQEGPGTGSMILIDTGLETAMQLLENRLLRGSFLIGPKPPKAP